MIWSVAARPMRLTLVPGLVTTTPSREMVQVNVADPAVPAESVAVRLTG